MWILGLKGLTKFTKTTVKPPLTVSSLQQPLYFVPVDKKSIHWGHLYNEK